MRVMKRILTHEYLLLSLVVLPMDIFTLWVAMGGRVTADDPEPYKFIVKVCVFNLVWFGVHLAGFLLWRMHKPWMKRLSDAVLSMEANKRLGILALIFAAARLLRMHGMPSPLLRSSILSLLLILSLAVHNFMMYWCKTRIPPA